MTVNKNKIAQSDATKAARPTGYFSSPKKGTPFAVQLLQVWHDEIQKMANSEFDSMNLAVDAMVDVIGQRLSCTSEERDFLRVVMTTDPTLCAELESAVRIKSSK